MSPSSPPSFDALVTALRAEMAALRTRVVALETENRELREQAARAPDAAGGDVPALLTELQRLRQENERLRRGQKNSSNSSKPPSSDHPHDPKSERKTRKQDPPSDRKRGGQPGHPGKTRELRPTEAVQHVEPCFPPRCQHCPSQHPLQFLDPTACVREQVWELPPIEWHITEFQRHQGTCVDCQRQTFGERPANTPAGCLGFRAQAVVGLLTGGTQITRRAALTLLRELTGLPLSLGTLSATEAVVSAALEQADAEVAAAVRAAPVVHCDETPWRNPGSKPWLWVATTGAAALFRIASCRNTEAYRSLGLDEPGQKKVTDRYAVYVRSIPELDHQVCWSHLVRDFAAWVDHREAGAAAHWWSDLTREVFHEWHRYVAGEIDRATLQALLSPVQERIRVALRMGAASGVAKFTGLCRNLLDRWESLWTFVRVEGVEPTNNTGERALRQAVLWRKVSLFTQSQRGQEYVERMLTVKTTLRQQGGNLLEFLTETLRAVRAGLPPPKLLPAPLA